jgi:type VI protein secretion system component VasF
LVFWDDLIRRWRREVRGLSPRLLRATAGHVALLPAPSTRRRSRLPWLVLLALVLAVIVLFLQSGQVQAILEALST